MSTTATVPSAGGEQKISALGRVVGVLFNPKETFTDIARKPTWLLPIIISGVMGLAFAWVMNQRVDWYSFIRQQIEMSPRAASMSVQQIQQAAQVQARITPTFVYVFGTLGGLIFSLWLALVYWGSFSLLAGLGVRFKQGLGIAAHALMTGLVSGPVTMLVMFLKERGDVDPNNMLASSLGAFLAHDAPAWQKSLGTSFELFWFWTLFLLAVGFAAVNPRKVSLGKSLGIVIGVWLLGVFMKLAWTLAFS